MNLEVEYLIKQACERHHIAFMRYMFKNRENAKFIVNKHHEVICHTLDRVYKGEIKRLIINIPPGYTKTEAAVIGFIARGLAINPKSKYIHVSYAAKLASENSRVIQDVVQMDAFQKFWPMRFRKESAAVRKWYTDKGGGLIAEPSGGQITGFRAGLMTEDTKEFTGAFIIDDPLKIDDAYSETQRTKVNDRMTTVFKSRLAHEDIPIILIMQRVHEDDPAGYLLKGGTGEKWHHLVLPAEITKDYEYPKEYTHGIHIPHNLPPGELWAYKHTLEQLEVMKKNDPYTTASQYLQSPAPLEGGLYKEEWWKFYEEDPSKIDFEYKFVVADTAQKTGEHNDYTVFGCWGYKDKKLYLIDIARGKWESYMMKEVFKKFWSKHYIPNATTSPCKMSYVEDMASGTDLIQNVKREKRIPITGMKRNKDKLTRAMDSIPYVASGCVLLPKNKEFTHTFIKEMSSFTPVNTHKHDDQVDVFNDAVEIALAKKNNRIGAF